MDNSFLSSLKDALADCDLAQAEAEAELPQELRAEHSRLHSHVLAAWETMMWKYPNNRALEALALIADFRTKVKGLALRIQADERPIDLTLVKTRPGFAGHTGGGKVDPKYSK